MLRVASVAERRSRPTWSTPGSPCRNRRSERSSCPASVSPLARPGAGAGTVVVSGATVGRDPARVPVCRARHEGARRARHVRCGAVERRCGIEPWRVETRIQVELCRRTTPTVTSSRPPRSKSRRSWSALIVAVSPSNGPVGVDLPGLWVDGQHDVSVALRELLRRGNQRRLVGSRVLRHRITS